MPRNNVAPAIEVKNLIVRYKRFVAVDGVSFTVNQGEIFGLLGPNGAGKTSIIRALSTLKGSCAGIAKIHGLDVFKKPFQVRRIICLVPQHNSLDPLLNVHDNLYFYAWLQGVHRNIREEKVNVLLDVFGLSQKRRALVTSLSGGQYRRLQLAKIFLSDAMVYFLDEPSIGLDYQAKEIFWRFLKRTCKQTGITIVIATNDLSEAGRLCDRVAFLNNGKVIRTGTPDELESALNKKVVHVQFDQLHGSFLSLSAEIESHHAQVEKVLDNSVEFRYQGNGGQLPAFVQELQKVGSIRTFTLRPPSLQDVFLELLSKEKNKSQ
ncbi:MAG: ATP-binding cassette domain-containing protein [Bacteroidota bacterium]